MSDNQTAATGNTTAAPEKTEVQQQESQATSAAAPTPEKPADKTATPAVEAKPTESKPSPEPDKLELAIPEGSKLTQSDVDRIASFAKDHGLSKDAAAAMLKQESDSMAARETAALSELQAQSEAWKQEIIADTEFGGERANETAQLAHDFAKRFGDQEFVSELERTGLGNHPGLVKLFARAGKAMASDSFKSSGQPAGSKKASPESKLYANTTPI